MVARVFDDILLKGIRSGEAPGRTTASREWYRQQAAKTRVSQNQLTGDTNRRRDSTAVGNMYFFGYEAKHKEKLPYYDRFPLIFPIGSAPGGFMGINVHYLPPRLRAQLMDALYDTASNDKLDSSTKLRINYNILKGASKFRLFKPCIKHYLSSQVRTDFVYVEPAEWDIALFLPTASFAGASKNKVYADSRKIING